MNLKAVFIKNNRAFLHKILAKDAGVIYTNSIIDPENPVFDKPYYKTYKTN